MKIKNYLVLFLSIITLSISAQEKNTTELKKDKDFEIVVVAEGKLKPNQLVLNFLKMDSRFRNSSLTKLIKDLHSMKSINYNDHNDSKIRPKKAFGQPTRPRIKIFLDNELILDDGFNRLHALNQLRMKDIKTIKRKNVSIDKEIYIYKI